MTGFKAKHCKENRPAHQKEKKYKYQLVSSAKFSMASCFQYSRELEYSCALNNQHRSEKITMQ